MSTALVLIGGRSAVPAISGILQFLDDISKIKFLVCKGEEYEKLQRTAYSFIKDKKESIDFVPDRDVKVVDPYNFTQVLKSLTELLAGEEEVSFASLASAPQTMSIASYGFLQKKFPTATIFTVSTDQAIIIPLKENEAPIPFQAKLSVEDYIRACGHEIFKRKAEDSFTFQNQNQLKELVFYFAENIESVDSILHEIRQQAASGGDSIKSSRKVSFSGDLINDLINKNNLVKPFVIKFLEELQEHSLIEQLDTSCDISFRVNPEQFSFLRGDWLELLVYLNAQDCKFDSVEPSIELSSYNGEIDLFCLYNSNPLICECKTGKFDKKEILKLRNIAEKLGESYCLKILVVSATEIPDEIEQEAKNSRVKIFNGKDLINLPDLLKKEMENPEYTRR
ncbi:Card1-like endonuclease domain-containing protein [Leptolyngbya sp. O-77]|uniref:Card1-like endonuclease domain-containing protein n=1 Tax=Leptolyngbya sp. O-77 TaxID=1080068 RepID=UPI00074D412D|nr:DUF1887 family CARF protein [Leptolyngbya sp. O-77]BAU44923.1 hypothetical protein O77CONTIG1_04769 [Leptolyngbya sp. O-77]